VFLDNVMALTLGDKKDEDSWSKTLPLVNALTRRRAGQLWVHHTGHDASRAYGTKTREWRLDTTIHLTAVERPDVDISFMLEFRKARERTPENRAEFADVTIALVNDQWRGSGAEAHKGRPSPTEAAALRVLAELAVPPGATPRQDGWAVEANVWGAECLRRGFVTHDGHFRSVRTKLATKGLIKSDGALSWPA
jgi:hypothetical protein